MRKKSMRAVIGSVMIVAMGWSAPVMAQAPRAGEASGAQEVGTVVKPVTDYDFEPDQVEGALVKPGEEDIVGRTGVKTRSLIVVRTDFVPELLQSVDAL